MKKFKREHHHSGQILIFHQEFPRIRGFPFLSYLLGAQVVWVQVFTPKNPNHVGHPASHWRCHSRTKRSVEAHFAPLVFHHQPQKLLKAVPRISFQLEKNKDKLRYIALSTIYYLHKTLQQAFGHRIFTNLAKRTHFLKKANVQNASAVCFVGEFVTSTKADLSPLGAQSTALSVASPLGLKRHKWMAGKINTSHVILAVGLWRHQIVGRCTLPETNSKSPWKTGKS